MTEVASLRERQIAAALGKLFVQRRDVKAEQHKINGKWARKKTPIGMRDVLDHIRGERSIGHYLLDTDNKCRVFALDIDLRKSVSQYPLVDREGNVTLHEYIPREAWEDRAHASRLWTKLSLRVVADKIARVIMDDLELPCLVSYSGSKGLHVYAFFDQPIDARDAHEGAILAIEKTGLFKPLRGKNFYEAIDQTPVDGYPNLEVETYPKQDAVSKDGYGNLMRLPLGRNFKSRRDTSFFVDMSDHGAELKPIDPLMALTLRDPYCLGRATTATGE
ncbi:hypothetical protein AB0F25_30455 [Streptomyces wedmorensis]|uniref:TOTE conflict system archaeo-eukaryotic primase domain-containing protein n=1 Tax=Streptomyces wedmorensis TaxID=43759 RepID=UPI00343EBD13